MQLWWVAMAYMYVPQLEASIDCCKYYVYNRIKNVMTLHMQGEGNNYIVVLDLHKLHWSCR